MSFIINKEKLRYGILPFIMNNIESVICAMLFIINNNNNKQKNLPSSLPTVITRKLTRLTIIATKNL